MNPKRIITSVAFTALALSGCGSLSESYRREVLSSVSPAKATLVIVRGQGSPLDPPVVVNENELCRLDDNTYCIVQAEAGRSTISSSGYFRNGGFKRLSTAVDLKAGQVSYVKIDSNLTHVLPIPLPGFVFVSAGANFGIAEIPESEFIRMRSYINRRPY